MVPARETSVPPVFRVAHDTAWMDEARKRVDVKLEAIARRTAAFPECALFAEAERYAVLGGGKRLRPLLTLAAIELYRPLDEEAVELSLTTELIHAATLVLDDLPSMDDARLRRGRPVHHQVFGESTTLLAALALWAEAARIASAVPGDPMRDILRELVRTVGIEGLVRGQYLDLSSAGRAASLSEVADLSYLKTGILLRAAVAIGGLYGGAPAHEQEQLVQFGRAFGELYQVRDDLLDAVATEAEAGKDVGADTKRGRPTFVTVLGAEGARALLCDTAAKAEDALRALPRDTGRLRALLALARDL